MPRMRFHARPGEDPPRLGDFMKATRGRGAYEVVGIRAGRKGLAGVQVYHLDLERYSLADIPEGTEFFGFQWFSRAPKRP